jgi:hypothetical protein
LNDAQNDENSISTENLSINYSNSDSNLSCVCGNGLNLSCCCGSLNFFYCENCCCSIFGSGWIFEQQVLDIGTCPNHFQLLQPLHF